MIPMKVVVNLDDQATRALDDLRRAVDRLDRDRSEPSSAVAAVGVLACVAVGSARVFTRRQLLGLGRR